MTSVGRVLTSSGLVYLEKKEKKKMGFIKINRIELEVGTRTCGALSRRVRAWESLVVVVSRSACLAPSLARDSACLVLARACPCRFFPYTLWRRGRHVLCSRKSKIL